MCRPGGPYGDFHAAPTDTHRPARARHRRPPRRSLARGERDHEWNLEVVGAFMRAAYGKGYCDALTEDAPGSLCVEHGYRVPERPERRRTGRRAASGRRAARTTSGVARKANPARLVIALSVAAALAVFLLYTSIAGGGTPSLRPSTLAGHTGKVSLAGRRAEAGDRRRARRRPALPPARRQGHAPPCPSSTRARARPVPRRPRHRRRGPLRERRLRRRSRARS